MSKNEPFAPWQCPLCGEKLTGDSTLRCTKGHCFDRAKEGYWHLLPVQSMRTKAPGDSKEMVAARRRFLDTGGYACFSDGLNALVCSLLMELPAPSLVDAGCGEGYYTARLVQALRASGKTPSAAAFDISKFAVKAAARRDKAHAVQWAVASSFAIPVADAAADCLVDIFSPAAAQEFARVVKPGGAFVFAVPGPRHLYGLKEVLYERPYENTVQDVAYPGFALDADSVQEARKRILEEKERGKLILIASHYPEDIQSLCDEVYWMKNGHVLPSKENK